MDLPFDPAVPLLGICLKKPETLIGNNICIPMLTAALFTTAETQKQPRCPSVEEWIKQLWYAYTMKHYPAVKQKDKKKKKNSYLWDSMDGRGEYYTKCNNPFRER